MGTFDDAVDRHIAHDQQTAKNATVHANAVHSARESAADELVRHLRELADYLQRKTSPISIEVRRERKWYKAPLVSPRGFVLSSGNEQLSHIGALVLTPDGRLWAYSPGLYHHRAGDGEYINIHDKFTEWGCVSIAHVTFSSDERTGALLAKVSNPEMETYRQVDPTEALAGIAATLLQKGPPSPRRPKPKKVL